MLEDKINKPRHYIEGRDIEPISVIEDWELNFNLGNALKYISRCERKGSKIEDLKKAVFYINREIQNSIIKEVVNDNAVKLGED